MSATTISDLSQIAGPVPLPSPYPLQPGFTPVSDLSQITSPGNYQLTADYSGVAKAVGLSDSTIDGAGRNVATLWVENCRNVVLKNFNSPSLVASGDLTNTMITNSWFLANNAVGGAVANIWGSGLTISHCAFDGGGGDDDILTIGMLSNLTFVNNIFTNIYDGGIEGAGGWDHCTFRGNSFRDCPIWIGGWFTADGQKTGFTFSNCTFENNTMDFATVKGAGRSLFHFNWGWYLDDAAAMSDWGRFGNTFAGNHWLNMPNPTTKDVSVMVTH